MEEVVVGVGSVTAPAREPALASRLRHRIETFGACCTAHTAPFEWTESLNSIMQKLARLNKVISGTLY